MIFTHTVQTHRPRNNNYKPQCHFSCREGINSRCRRFGSIFRRYDRSDQAVTIQTDPEEVPPIMAWEVEAAHRKMKNGKEAENIKLTLKH